MQYKIEQIDMGGVTMNGLFGCESGKNKDMVLICAFNHNVSLEEVASAVTAEVDSGKYITYRKGRVYPWNHHDGNKFVRLPFTDYHLCIKCIEDNEEDYELYSTGEYEVATLAEDAECDECGKTHKDSQKNS